MSKDEAGVCNVEMFNFMARCREEQRRTSVMLVLVCILSHISDGLADQCRWCHEELLHWRLPPSMARRAGASQAAAGYSLIQQSRAYEHMISWSRGHSTSLSSHVSPHASGNCSKKLVLSWTCCHCLNFRPQQLLNIVVHLIL
ncbi:unnamed protein product [Musa textilis]